MIAPKSIVYGPSARRRDGQTVFICGVDVGEVFTQTGADRTWGWETGGEGGGGYRTRMEAVNALLKETLK